MIFFFVSFTLSHQVFDITLNWIKSLFFYFQPRYFADVEVSSGLKTYFSDITKANGISLEIQTNYSSTFGPFNHQSHLDGIDFVSDDVKYTLSFANEGDYEIELAMVFGEILESSLNIINQNIFLILIFRLKTIMMKKISKIFTWFCNDEKNILN